MRITGTTVACQALSIAPGTEYALQRFLVKRNNRFQLRIRSPITPSKQSERWLSRSPFCRPGKSKLREVTSLTGNKQQRWDLNGQPYDSRLSNRWGSARATRPDHTRQTGVQLGLHRPQTLGPRHLLSKLPATRQVMLACRTLLPGSGEAAGIKTPRAF